MTEPEARLLEILKKMDRATAPEPATSRALWPTFMRRTLAEETLRRDPPQAQSDQPRPA